MSDAEPSGARIIAFPGRPPSAAGEVGHERLQRALTALNAAVTTQRNAVLAWRASLEDLRTAMQGLGDSIQGYRNSLDQVGARVASLRREAVKLEHTADMALAHKAE